MNAASMPGVQEWTPTEITQKEDAVKKGASRTLASVVKSAVGDEYEIVMTDGDALEADWSYLLSAQNHLLAQLNFPNKLKPFLDTIISSACGNGDHEFSATNLEIGQKSRSGRDACSDKSMEKWVSRHKRALEEWMAYKSFHLVRITDGEYDFERNKRYPTRYQVFFNQYVAKAVNLAKTKFYWNKGKDQRALRNRALREAARQTLLEIPEAPNLALRPAKQLSEEQKFDRRHHSMLTFMEKNRDALKRVGFDHTTYFRFLVGEMDRIASNPPGMIGKLLTPEADEPDHRSSVWRKIKTGEILEDVEKNDLHLDHKFDILEDVGFNHVDYAVEATRGEEKEIQTPKYFRDGQMVDSDQRFEEAPKTEKVLNKTESDNHFKHQGDIFVSAEETSINSGDFEENESLSTKGTFLSSSEPENSKVLNNSTDLQDKLVPGSELDFTDWFNDAADVRSDPVLTEESLQALFEGWLLQVKTLVPDKTPGELWKGAWQVYLDLEFATEPQIKALREMNAVRADVLAGTKGLIQFRTAFCEWVAAGASFYQNGVTVPQSAQKIAQFAARLETNLKVDDG